MLLTNAWVSARCDRRRAVRLQNGHAGRVSQADDHLHVKVRFQLEVDADGWPPVGSEGLWAEPLGNDEFRIDNTPWFVRKLAADDVVRALAGSDDILWVIEKVRWSGRMTIRVIPRKDGPIRGDRQAVLDAFSPFGVSGEGVERYGIVALDVPPDVEVSAVKALLKQGEEDGRWHFERAA